MPEKRTISTYDAVIHIATPKFYAQLDAPCKKHGLNAFVDMKLCKRYCTSLFIIIFHSFNFEIMIKVILTCQTFGMPKFILLTELSTGRSPVLRRVPAGQNVPLRIYMSLLLKRLQATPIVFSACSNVYNSSLSYCHLAIAHRTFS